ncbi:MAG: zinc-ribbon domain-containing protein [bacterium]
MLVRCDNCGAKYRLTIKKRPGKTVTFKCSKCRHPIRIHPDDLGLPTGGEAEQHSSSVQAVCSSCGKSFVKSADEEDNLCRQCRIDSLVKKVKQRYGVDTSELKEPEEESSRYTVRSADGLVLGPVKLRTVKVLAREKKIRGQEEVSKDDSEYKPLMSYPELQELFPELKEVMDTSGLEDKLDEAFSAAFGGEQEPAEAPEQEAAPASQEEPLTPPPPDAALSPEEGEEKEAEPEPAREDILKESEEQVSAGSEESPPEEISAEAPASEGPETPPAPEEPAPEPPEPEEASAALEEEASSESSSTEYIESWPPPGGARTPAEEGPEDADDVLSGDDLAGIGQEARPAEPEEAAEEVPAQPSPAEEVPEKEAPEQPAPAEEAEEAAKKEAPAAPVAVSGEKVGTEFDLTDEEEPAEQQEKEGKEEEEIIEDLEPCAEPAPDTRYQVRYPDGMILGPVKLGTIKELYESGNLTGDEEVQREEGSWKSFADMPELVDLISEEEEEEVVELTDVLEES